MNVQNRHKRELFDQLPGDLDRLLQLAHFTEAHGYSAPRVYADVDVSAVQAVGFRVVRRCCNMLSYLRGG